MQVLLLTSAPTGFYHQNAFWVMTVSLSIVCFLIVMYILLRTKFNRERVYHRRIARSYERELEQLRADNRLKEDELHRQEQNLLRKQQDLDRVTMEIENYKSVLKEKEKMLEGLVNQNKSFMRLLHQTELEGSADDIIDAVRQSSEGKRVMEEDDWKRLMAAVDQRYPDFNDTLIRRMGRVDRQELRVCYLLRIGLNNPQIQNITNLPRTTVWRWTKKYEWITNSNEDGSTLPA